MLKAFIISIITFVSTSLAYAQSEDDILKTYVQVITTFIDKNGNTVPEKGFGAGFIIDGEYLATCYHVIYPPGNHYKPKKVKVNYNFRLVNKILQSDSVNVDLTYKYQKKQYDFSKHKYIENSYETDFIILKLKKKVKYENLVFSTDTDLPKYSLFPTIGFDDTINSVRSVLLKYLYRQIVKGKQDSYQLGMFGFAKHGFSGSPVFNGKNQVIGVLQYGNDEINLTELNKLPQQDIIDIKKGYLARDKQTISFATNIKYLNEKYISSFKK